MTNVPLGRMGCLGCDGTYAIGFLHCPHCGTRSPLYPPQEGEEDEMPKITVGGASNAAEVVEDDGSVSVSVGFEADAPVLADVVAPVEEDPAPVIVAGEHGPELVMLGTPGAIHGAEGLEVLKTAPAQDGELSAADVAAGYTDLSFAQLRAEAKTRGLPAGGTAVELAARLGEHDTTQTMAPVPAGETTETTEEI